MNESWGSQKVVTRGVIHQADSLPGFVADVEGKIAGFLTWHVSGKMLEIVTLNVLNQREGIGTVLVNASVEEANALKCSRVWVITTNDNAEAVKFYQSVGFKIVAIHKDTIEESRKLKPEIPRIGIGGIPITDEIELERIP